MVWSVADIAPSVHGPLVKGFYAGPDSIQSKALALCRDASTQLSSLGKQGPNHRGGIDSSLRVSVYALQSNARASVGLRAGLYPVFRVCRTLIESPATLNLSRVAQHH